MSENPSTMQVWAIPLGFEVFGHEIGDHTWVASNDGFCEGCRFGVVTSPDPLYCQPGRWVGGKYTPPPSPTSRKLREGPASRTTATCMAGGSYRFMGIPSQSGIVYAINGVCHTLTNRTLFPTNLTADGANGYWFIQATYGTYGTTIPWAFIPPLIWPIPPIPNPLFLAAVAFQIGIAVEWQKIRENCGTDVAKTLESGGEGDRFLHAVQSLHAQPLLETVPETWTAGIYNEFLERSYQRHMAEIDLAITYRGQGIVASKLDQMRALWAEVHRPHPEQIETALAVITSERPSQAAVEISRDDALLLAHTMNLKATDFQRKLVDVLGPSEYGIYFGEQPDTPFLLVDPTILSAAVASR